MKLAFTLIIAGLGLPAEEIFSPADMAEIQGGIRELYSLEHDKAIARFEEKTRRDPNDPAGYAYSAWAWWLRELAARQELGIDRFASAEFFSTSHVRLPAVEPVVESRFRELSEKARTLARRQLQRNPRDLRALYLLGFAYQNLASFEVSVKRSWWSAFRAGSKTYRYHRDLLKLDPQFEDARLSTGVYEYVVGSLGPTEKVFAFLMGHSGSKEAGRRDIQMAADRGKLVSDDARVTLALIHARERDYAKALEQMQMLYSKYPRNYLVRLDMAGTLMRLKRYPDAIAIYQEMLKQRPDVDRALLYNRMGVAARESGDVVQSIAWLGRVLSGPAAVGRSATIARLELGKSLEQSGNVGEAERQWREVAKAPDVAGSQQEAQLLLDRLARRRAR